MQSFSVPRLRVLAGVLGLSAALGMSPGVAGQRPAAQAPAPTHGKAAPRLLIRNAMVIYGNAKPAFGPVDILVQDGLIARIGPAPPKDPPPDAVIDATGKYVMPGIVNAHMHLQDERGGVAAADPVRDQPAARVRRDDGARRRLRPREGEAVARGERRAHARRAAHPDLHARVARAAGSGRRPRRPVREGVR